MTSASDSPNRHALLIGINKYPNFAREKQLFGCVNDVDAMAKILQENFKFPADHVVVVRNEQATQLGIRSEMKQLIARVGQDDIVVLYYSGHGSQMPDLHQDEASGKDNTIVPYDSARRNKPNRDILDDEIHLWLAQLTQKTRYVTLIFDCCHSGSMARDAFGDRERWIPADDRPAEQLQWDVTGSPLLDAAEASQSRGIRDVGPSGWLPRGDGYVLLAGSEDAESSWELTTSASEGAITHGALTYFLLQELRQVGPGTTYREVYERVHPLVTAKYPRQHPQIEGKQDREIFDTRDVEPLRFVAVVERNGDTVRLAAGAAHGMTIGSQWAIYPQGTKSVDLTTNASRLGLAEITHVRAVSAEAKLVEISAPDSVRSGCYAIEYAHNYGDMQLKLAIAPVPQEYEDNVGGLSNILQASRLLHVNSEGDEHADLRIYLLPPRATAGTSDPVPELGALDSATWAVVNRDGLIVMPKHAVDEAGVLTLLYDNLVKLARYRYSLALRNSDPTHLLNKKVDLILKRQRRDGTWEAIDIGSTDEKVIFEADDRIAFEIVNRHTAPVYVSVLDFGLTGTVSLLHPPNRASEKLEAGVHITIGERDEDKIELYVPDELAYDEGVETFKLLATTQPTDFSWMQQEGVRSIDGSEKSDGNERGSLLQQLFDFVYNGFSTRDARPTAVAPAEEWTTVERTFTLRRKTL